MICHKHSILSSILILLVSSRQHSCINSLSVPQSNPDIRQQKQRLWKFNAAPDQQPILASAVSALIHVATRTSLLVFPSIIPFRRRHCYNEDSGTIQDLTVKVCATSNRNVLRGKFDKLSVHAHQSKSSILNWLQVSDLELYGTDLDFGWKPCMVCTAPFFLLAVLTIRPLFILPALRLGLTMYLYYYMLHSVYDRFNERRPKETSSTTATTTTTTTTDKHLQNSKASFLSSIFDNAWFQKNLGGRPSTMNYRITFSNEDITNSLLLKRALQMVLKSLMENSVLKTAAIAGDTMNMLQQQQQQQQQESSRSSMPKLAGTATNTDVTNTTPLLLPPSSSEPSPKLTKLLSATSFKLKEAQLVENRLQMSCQAILPQTDEKRNQNRKSSDSSFFADGDDDENAENTKSKLDFTLRMNLDPTEVVISSTPLSSSSNNNNNDNNNNAKRQQKQCSALGFTSPECKFDVTATTMRNNIIGKLLLPPVVWIPVGVGVAIPLFFGLDKNKHCLKRVEILKDGQCKIDGCFFTHAADKQQRKQNSKIVLR